ncbi:NAD(P)H-dependent flavin oxidoreductase, partial [Methylobacterium indicum]|uniref:NAD(P)H-dependent flavin oxidoreductase n=1 Tax=Methylobacterium indicum TaxID=1775910 RepID=UPI000653566C
MTHPALARAEAFAATYGLRRPVLLAPMAGACPPALSLAVMRAGGLGACGALPMQPPAILAWAEAVREAGPFQINLWIPDPAPVRDPAHEARLRAFLGGFGPAVAPEAGDAMPPDFFAQCEAVIQARPRIVSSIMGLYPPDLVARFKASGIAWWATVTTVAEALAAEAAGADAVVAQGAEAGGHRGSFDPARAEMAAVGLMALLPAVVDAVTIPVVATGGIADARGAAAALLLGASAVQVGTGFLRCPEAGIASAWAEGLGRARPEETRLTRAFSGRAGRSLATEYVAAAAAAATYSV